MKKFASLALATAMILSLAGCGQQDTAASDNSSVIAPSEPDVTSTSATTTSATTIAATTTTTEVTTTTAPVVEEVPVQADPTAITGDVTLNAASSIAKGTLVDAYGDVAILYNEADRTYYLADINGEPINDTVYSYVDRGFDENGYAIVSNSDYISCVIDKQGNVIHENVISLSDGVMIKKEKTGSYINFYMLEVDLYKYTYIDIATGTELHSIDENADPSAPCNYYVCPMINGYSVYFLEPEGSFIGCKGVSVVDANGNITAVYDENAASDIIRDTFGANTYPVRDQYYYDNSNLLFLQLSIDDEFNTAIYDMTDSTMLLVEGYMYIPTFIDRDNGIFALTHKESSEIHIVDDKFNLLLDGLTTAVDSGSDKYLLISDGEKWGYYVIDSGEVVWYDDATNFHNGYAFVIEDGKGHFVNEAFEAVTDDIAATGATHYDGLLYLVDTDQLYPVNYPAAE